MIKTFSRAASRKKYPSLPISKYRESVLTYPKVYKSYVFTLPSKSARGHAKSIALSIQRVMINMGYEHLIFMGDTTTPWLYKISDYIPTKAALDYLIENNITKTFNGGLIVNINELYPFIAHLFWLVRTNTVLPNVYGIDEWQNILVNICQYGNLHIDTLNKTADNLLHANISSSGLHARKGNTCTEPWGRGGKIEGRSVLV